MTRLRKPKIREGELQMYWGRDGRGNTPEVMFSYRGDASMKRDLKLLINATYNQQPDPHATPLFSKMRPSLVEELEMRGYDLTTLKFSIMKGGE